MQHGDRGTTRLYVNRGIEEMGEVVLRGMSGRLMIVVWASLSASLSRE
jgi:hypothetical protein